MTGGDFYDDPDVLERYRAPRPGVSDPRDTMEHPAIAEAIGDVAGLRVLDLGCGDGRTGATLLDAGAETYVGVDASERMVADAAERLAGRPATIRHAALEAYFPEPAGADLVVSFLALHYVANLKDTLRRARSGLTAGGRLVATVVHPVVTSHDARRDPDELRTSWVVDDYFERGERPQRWLGGTVTWHHRTIEDHLDALRDAGFELQRLRECEPRPERFTDPAELARRRRIPKYLLLAASAS